MAHFLCGMGAGATCTATSWSISRAAACVLHSLINVRKTRGMHAAMHCAKKCKLLPATHSRAFTTSLSPSATARSFGPETAAAQETSDETIVALSSGSSRSAVAVIRISGPAADKALKAVLKDGSSLPSPRAAALRSLYDPASRELLDKALVLRFPAPGSFTGEDVVELQGHGGPAGVKALLSALTALPGLRLAEAGEFTRRAFMVTISVPVVRRQGKKRACLPQGGKLDLTEVEGIADLLAAETAAQHRQALQQTSGVQRRQYESWRKTLLNCLAHVEAVIDFGDDNDIDSGVASEVLPAATNLRTELERHLREARRGELVRDGVRVALIGPPNAGKSTLLNHLAGREAAIVSPIPGTTRDSLEVILELAGQKVILADTAGLRETEDLIEAEGVSRARKAAQNADVVIAVADVSAPEHDQALLDLVDNLALRSSGLEGANGGSLDNLQLTRLSSGWSSSQEALAAGLSPNGTPAGRQAGSSLEVEQTVLVFNKCDLASMSPFQVNKTNSDGDAVSWLRNRLGVEKSDFLERRQRGQTLDEAPSGASQGRLAVSDVLGISAGSGEGLDLLLDVLEKRVADVAGRVDLAEGYMITRLRHRQHVEECVEALRGYEAVHDQLELASEELRIAAKSLGKVTGAIDIEHILDAIFSEFCVGK